MTPQDIEIIKQRMKDELLSVPLGETFRDGPLCGASVFNAKSYAIEMFLRVASQSDGSLCPNCYAPIEDGQIFCDACALLDYGYGGHAAEQPHATDASPSASRG